MAEKPRKSRGRFIYLLNVAQRRLQAAIQNDEPGRTAARSGLLMAISPSSEGTQMARLGQALDLGPGSLSGLIDRTEKAGLIRRCNDPADGRAWTIVLTEAGQVARKAAVDGARELNSRLCEGFSDDELDVVARWLEATSQKFARKDI